MSFGVVDQYTMAAAWVRIRGGQCIGLDNYKVERERIA